LGFFLFFKQKTAYEFFTDWSSDVCSSDLELALRGQQVILLDADPQGSALDWTQRRSQQGLPRLFGAVGLARETLHQEAPELARQIGRASCRETVRGYGAGRG